MNTSRVSPPSGDKAYVSIFWFTALFAAVTYVAISARAVLNPYEVNHILDAKRVFSVTISAVVLWLSIRAANRLPNHGLGAQLFALLNIAIPGAIGLLIAREAYDLIASGEFATRFALNIRWMLNWIGYFAAAVAGFVALQTHRRLQAINGIVVPVTVAAVKTSTGTDYENADLDFDPRTAI